MKLSTHKPKLPRAAILCWLVCAIAAASSSAFASGAIAATHATPSGDACGRIDFAPQSDNVAFDIRSFGASCSAARAVAGGSRPGSLRPGRSHTYRADGFLCRGQFVQPQGKDYEHYVCARGRAHVVFDRG